MFLNTVHQCYLTQFINKPTHSRVSQNPTLIDLILSNDPDFVFNLVHHPPFGKSHHDVICFNIHMSSKINNTNPVFKYLINKGDFEGMRDFMSKIDWSDILKENNTIDQVWNDFETILNKAKEKFVPLRKQNSKSRPVRSFTAQPTLLYFIQLK